MGAAGGLLDVAKKRAKTPTTSPAPTPPPAIVPRPAMLTVRCSEAWLDWVKEVAEADRSATNADLIDRAIVAYARMIGFQKVAPKR